MLVFSVVSALEFLESKAKATKGIKNIGLRAEVTVTTRTTPNNLFLSVCKKKLGGLLYWISRGRSRFDLLKFNNFFSISKMFTEIVAYLKKYSQCVFKLKSKGRSRTRRLMRELKKWRVPVFYIAEALRRPFNGCKFPHTRRV